MILSAPKLCTRKYSNEQCTSRPTAALAKNLHMRDGGEFKPGALGVVEHWCRPMAPKRTTLISVCELMESKPTEMMRAIEQVDVE
jgi:hypothetical protein